MPIDLNVVGQELPSMEFNYTQKDVILYALGVGAGPDPDELKYVYENGLEVLPTYGVIPPFPALMGLIALDGVDINPVMLLHGEQYLEIKKHPIPVEGTLTTIPRVANIYDKGKGALIELGAETKDESGDVVFFNTFGAFIRGEGGFGGEKGPAAGNEPPERDPDTVVELKTLPQASMIYRLSGDLNPLHIDPNFAAMAGYDKPIIHGLCSFGHLGRAVLKAYCDNDPSKFKSIKVRFSRPAYPGETLASEFWKVEDDTIIARVRVAERGEYTITNCAIKLNV